MFRGHTQRVNSLVFSPDGRSIISGSMDGTVRILDMTDKSSKVLVTADSSNGVKAGVTSVAISSDGRLVAAGTIDTARHSSIFLPMSYGCASHRQYMFGTPVPVKYWKGCGDTRVPCGT